MIVGNFGSLARHLIQRHTLVKHCCRRSMHIHINEAKRARKGKERSESMKLNMKRSRIEKLD